VNPNLNPSKRADVVGSIDPDAYAAGTYTTGWIDMSKFFSVLAVVMAGTLGASATLDAKIQQAQDSGGTGAKDISGLAITQLTQAGADSNKQALVNVMQSDLDRANNFAFVRLSMTIGTAASDAGGVVLGLDPRYGDAEANDKASVDEIVS
jgi:hypothetical protein